MTIQREVFRLLAKHVSVPQIIAFAVANVVGILLLITAVQFYSDLVPLFKTFDGTSASDYLVVTKHLSTASMLNQNAASFTPRNIRELREQPFVEQLDAFTPSHFGVQAAIDIPGGGQYGTEMFFESVPDQYLDVKTDRWRWQVGDDDIPIILPRNYLNLYNFGFAQTRGLPKLSESALSAVPFHIYITGRLSYLRQSFSAHIVGFSNRLNTILVPDAFLRWANDRFGDGDDHRPTRLIMRINSLADAELTKYFDEHHLVAEQDALETGRAMWFLQTITGVVLAVGLIICALAFYILILSIFLLVQKNQDKLQTLRLLGYSVGQVAGPYTLIAVGLNVAVLLMAWIAFFYLRSGYLGFLSEIYPQLTGTPLWPSIFLSGILLIALGLTNTVIIRRKIARI